MKLRRIFDVETPKKNVKADQADAPRFLSRSSNPEQRTRHYIENRWHDQYTYYVSKAEHNRRQHLRLQLFIAVVAVLVPVMLGFNADIINWVSRLSTQDTWYARLIDQGNINNWISVINTIPAVLSGLVAAAAALENVQKYGDNWRAFQTAADGLERERALFEANSGPYRKDSNTYRLFVERSEDVIAQETGRYFARQEQKGEEGEEDPEALYNTLMSSDGDTPGAPAINSKPVYDDVDMAVTEGEPTYPSSFSG